ncbi:hypothetical protein A3N99_02850 [Mycobacteroides abscessus]|uniref:phage tail tape measure protein n=1 Tax=Mycobacteroides abscessus TaxID=36809 RepID=UPI00078CC33C|nr:phage tail tape measure protein [Mycobacteroides abscessus]AMU39246.1 hypothetical protein A3N99_02850 [Mycobacteroides abscessus]
MSTGTDFGEYYTLPVILSFDGIDKQVDRSLGAKFGSAGQKAGRDFGKGLGDGMRAGEAEVKKALDSYTRLQDKAADATGKVRAEEAKLAEMRRKNASDDRIVSQSERLEKAKRDEARALRSAADAQKDYEGAQSRLKLGGGSGDIDKLGLSWEGMGSKAAAAGAVVGTAAVAALAAAAVGAVALGKELYDLGGQFDETFDNLQIKTGASGPQLAALEQSVRGLSRSVPLSIGEIGNVVGEVNRSLHLTGPELDNVSKSIANLGRLTGEEVDVRGLGRAFRSFGVDAKDQQATLDSLFGAYQKTGIPVNQLVATVTKGGPALRQFGLDFGQSAGLISTFEEAGLDADKSIAALTKGLGTLAKTQGITGQEALRQTVSQIKELTDAGRDADALNLTNKIFGAKGGVQFFDAIKSGALDLQTLTNALDTTGASINDTAANTDDFEQKWQTFKNTAAVALEPLASGLFDVVNDGLGGMSDWVVEHQAEIIEFLGTAADGFLAMGKFALIGAGYAVKGFAMLLDPITDTLGGLFKAAAAVDDFFGNHDAANQERELAEKFFAIDDSVRNAGDAMIAGADKVDHLRDSLRGGFKAASDAARFVTALGDATASLPDGKTIKISENTPEVRAKLAAIGIQVQELPDKTVTVTANTEEGQRILDSWRKSNTNDPVEVPVGADTTKAKQDIEAMLRGYSTQVPQLPVAAAGPSAPLPGSVASFIPARATGGIFDVWDSVASFANGKLPNQALIQQPVGRAGLVQWAEPSTRGEAFIPLGGGKRSMDIWVETGKRLGAIRSFAEGGLNPGAAYVRGLIQQSWPQITNIGGYRPPDGYNEHSSGNALDVMIPKWNTPDGKALGDQVAGWIASNAETFGLTHFIWRQRIYKAGDTVGTPMEDRGDPTQNHMDHVHAWFQKGGGALPSGNIVAGQSLTGGGTSFGGGGAGSISAGGGGGPAGSMSGFGPGGQPGYYETDPRKVRESEERVRDADQRVKEAEARLRELDADAKDSQKLSAQYAVDKAKREAEDARADLGEAKKGKFTAAKGAGGEQSGKGAGGGGDELKQALKIGVGGILESFGMDGSWLPDLADLMPVKMADALLNSFHPGALFQPGAILGPAAGAEAGAPPVPAGGTSGLPFGIPDTMMPAPVGGDQYGPAPGPALGAPITVNQTVDQSQQFHGTVGWDPAEAGRQQTRNINSNRAMPRLPVGLQGP